LRSNTQGKQRIGGARAKAVMVLALVAAAALGVSWLRGRTGPTADDPGVFWRAGSAEGMNVLLVTLDTVRADRLGCYGYDAAGTPAIDSLAERGVLFEDAVTSVPLTLPSHATILTGLSPRDHGVRENGKYRLSEDSVTLAEALRSHGYDTAAFVGCFVLDARFGLDQGFDVYDFEVTPEGNRPGMPDYNERSAGAVTDAVISWLTERGSRGADAPFFAWVHYFDPHLPYRSPLESSRRFAGRPYDAEIAYVDRELGRLLNRLETMGLREKTLIVVVGDHGEAFGEHGEPTHGMLLYEGTLRVPFIVSCDALFDRPQRVSDRVVGLVDVRPTIEGLLGVSSPEACDGVNLAGAADEPDRAIYIETLTPLSLAGWSPLYGLRSHGSKYILAPEREYYDLDADRTESVNLYAAGGPGVERLERGLTAVMGAARERPASPHPLSDEEIERLGALGYVEARPPEDTTALADPKAMMPVYNDALRAENLYAAGRIEEAAALAAEVLEQSDMCSQAVRVLAFSYLRLGRPDDALDLLRRSVERKPDAFLVRSLAQALIIDGRYDEAEEALVLYEKLSPEDGRVPLLRGDILTLRDRPGEAITEYEKAIEIDENRVGIRARSQIQSARATLAGQSSG
jgi:choline-sulfatase